MDNTYIVRLTRIDADGKRRYGYVRADGGVALTKAHAYHFKIRYNAERVAEILGKVQWACGEVRTA